MANVNEFSGGLDQFTGAMGAKRSALNAGQRSETQDFLGRYGAAIGGQEKMAAMSDRIGQELGLPGKRQAATAITQTVNNMPYTYGAATKGYDVNANQLSRIVGTKTAELTPAMTSANQAVSDAEHSLDTRMGYEVADQNKALLPYNSEQSFLNDRLARESTGFSQDTENELEAILAKMSTGVALSEGEKNRANQLATAKMSFDAQMKQLSQNQTQFDKNYELDRQKNLITLASSFKK